MKPRSLEDLGIIVALNRPGPDSDLYLSRRETGEWERNEFTDDITGDTFGTFVYQEQIIRLMTKLGFSLERADDVRRFMGKKKVDDMKAFYPEFMAAAAKHMEQYEAQRLWDDVEIFASYGFNKSHSIGYAIIQLWTLVAKYTYPAEFMLACIRTDPEGAHRYISEALRMGIEVLPPDVNTSGFETELVDGKIIYGLKNVKGVASGAEWVVENRPFTSHKQMVELLEEQNKAYLKAKKDGEKVPATSPKQRFNAGKINALLNVGAFDKLGDRPEITDAEKRAFERDLLGVVLTDSTPAIFEKHDELIEANCNSYEELIDADEGDEFLIPGVITEITESKTRRNETMARMKMEFGGRRTEITVWPKLLSRYSYMLKEYIAVVAEVKIGNRGTPELKRVMELT
jgi:DNA polymerase-3 subunit alpha